MTKTNKKDKDDSKINTKENSNNKDEIDMIDIGETNTLKEITGVAKSLNLKVGGKKSEVLKRISDYIKNYKETRKKNIKIDAGNSDKKFVFDSKLNDLAIKDISNGELLFWKVFKNKVLFKTIASNFSKDRFHSYNNIIKVDWMIGNGHINLLFDKLKRNQPLIIDQSTSKWYGEIFKVIKSSISTSTQQDNSNTSNVGGNGNTTIGGGILEINEFYQLLFERFANYIHCPKKLIHCAIKYGCIEAIQVSLEGGYYNFEPESVSPPIETKKIKGNNKSSTEPAPITQQSLIIAALLKSFKYSKFTTFQYLYQNETVQSSNLKEINNSISSTVLAKTRNSIPCGVDYLKFLNYFLKSGILNKTQFNGKVGFWLNKYNFDLFPESIFQDYTLSQLIQTCQTLVQYNHPPAKTKSKSKSTETKSIQITLIEIESIENQFNDQQLQSNLKLLLLNLNSDSNNNNNFKSLLLSIKRLIEFYDQTIKHRNSIEYYLIFNVPLKHKLNSYYGYGSFIKSLEYGNSELLKWCFGYGGEFQIPDYLITEKYSIPLFKHCSNRDQKINFIKVWVTHLNNIDSTVKNNETTTGTIVTNINASISKMNSPFLLLHLLIANDDIELMQLFVDEIGIDKVNSTVSTEIHNNIRSIEMLNYCYSNFKNHFFEQSKGITSWYLSGRYYLLEAFEKLIGEEQNETLLLPLTDVNFGNYSIIPEFIKSLKTIEYIISKPTVYRYDNTIFKFTNFEYISQRDYQIIKNIIQYSDQTAKISISFNRESILTSNVLKFLEWLFTFEDGIQLKSGRVKFDNNQNYYKALALTDRIDCNLSDYIESEWYQTGVKYYSQNKFVYINAIEEIVSKTGDMKLLEILFTHFFIPCFTPNSIMAKHEGINILSSLLSNLILNQWLHLIQHIYYNHSKFMTDTTLLKPNGLNLLKNLRDLSISFGLLDTFNFFLKVVNVSITKIQYNKLLNVQIRDGRATKNLVFLHTRKDFKFVDGNEDEGDDQDVQMKE